MVHPTLKMVNSNPSFSNSLISRIILISEHARSHPHLRKSGLQTVWKVKFNISYLSLLATVLEDLLLKTNLYWPFESYSFNQENVLEFLMMNNLNIEKTINLIRYNDKSFTEFVNRNIIIKAIFLNLVKKAQLAEIKQIATKNKKTYM